MLNRPFHHRLPKKGTTTERCDIDEFGMEMELCRTTNDATASNAEHKKRNTPAQLLSKRVAFFQPFSIRENHKTTLFSGVQNSQNIVKRKIPEEGIKVKNRKDHFNSLHGTVNKSLDGGLIVKGCSPGKKRNWTRKPFLHCYTSAILACRDGDSRVVSSEEKLTRKQW
jgi:hypothetical protein